MQEKDQFNIFKKWPRVPGVLLCFALALPAWFMGRLIPVVGGPVMGILLGIITTQVFNIKVDEGIRFTSKKVLQYAIILLGFEMNLLNMLSIGSQSLFVMVFTLSGAFVAAYYVGKVLKLDANTTILIGVGTSICGGSAIAATAPVIRASDDEVAHAISTIFLFNIAAVFIFPALGHALGLNDIGFGMWAGTAINDTSSVVAAASTWSATSGNNTALAFATVVKLTRTLMIVPITFALALFYTRKQATHAQGSKFSFVKVFPWFVIGFIITAVLNTLIPMQDLSHLLVMIGKFLIVMAMVAIGLNTHLKKLLANGIKPILLGLSCWLTVAVVSLVVQGILVIW